ncbi:MAG: nitronate monooxygenase [Candidatus Eremiobacteraeota bacterium]|nr:nitronate monooxygenase [Candidatus Eremiobacteraeota bacterium]
MAGSLPFLDLPIVLAPMGGATTVRLVSAVSNAGAFGILPCAYLTPEQITAQITALRSETSRPFGVNVFVEHPPYAAGERALSVAHERLRPYREELRIAQPSAPATPPDRYARQIEAILEAKPEVFTFTFGIPDASTLRRLHDAGVLTLGTATTVDEARALAAAGVDGIFAQGAEAGAHRGTFLADVEESLIGTLALVPQVVDATGLPVIAAGGIGDGRGVAAVLALGAVAAALGTSFLLADESGIAGAYRDVLRSERSQHTGLTRAFSGRAGRAIPNRVTLELRDSSDIAPYPFQNAMTRDIRTAAADQGRAEFLSLWAGQAAILAKSEPAATIVANVMLEARAALAAAEAKIRFHGRHV